MSATPDPVPAFTARALQHLESVGLLLLSDSHLPSVVGLVAGGPVRGSWWAHPAGPQIFQTASRLGEHADVTTSKLVEGKVTFVHRGLWPALAAVGMSGSAWQTEGLPPAFTAVLDAVRAGVCTTNELKTLGVTAVQLKLLETRLLAHHHQEHSDGGHHVTRFESWVSWARRCGVTHEGVPLAEAERRLEQAFAALGAPHGLTPRAPWNPRSRTRTRRAS